MSAWGGCAGAGEKHAHRGSRFTATTACRRAGRIRSCARRCTCEPWLEHCPRVTQASRIRAYPMDHRRLSHAMLPLTGIGRSDGLLDTGKRIQPGGCAGLEFPIGARWQCCRAHGWCLYSFLTVDKAEASDIQAVVQDSGSTAPAHARPWL